MAFAKRTKNPQNLEVNFDDYVQIFIVTKCCYCTAKQFVMMLYSS